MHVHGLIQVAADYYPGTPRCTHKKGEILVKTQGPGSLYSACFLLLLLRPLAFLPSWMPTLLQPMVFLAFALAFVIPFSVLGFDPTSNNNVRLSSSNDQLLTSTHVLLRSLCECTENPPSLSLVEPRWPEKCRYWGQNSFGATNASGTAEWQQRLSFYCQVKGAHSWLDLRLSYLFL